MGKKEKAAIKVVLDTNVLVSSLLFQGKLAGIVRLWKKGRIIPLFSRDTFDEFKAVLEYPKFSLSWQERKNIIEQEVLPFFEVVGIVDPVKGICRDPDDDMFIACAVSASADFIVTGDKDLLDIGKYQSVTIISGSDLLKILDVSGG